MASDLQELREQEKEWLEICKANRLAIWHCFRSIPLESSASRRKCINHINRSLRFAWNATFSKSKDPPTQKATANFSIFFWQNQTAEEIITLTYSCGIGIGEFQGNTHIKTMEHATMWGGGWWRPTREVNLRPCSCLGKTGT